MWDQQLEKDESFSTFVTEEFLDQVVTALTERQKSAGLAHNMVELEMRTLRAMDTDVLASKFRIYPEEAPAAILKVQTAQSKLFQLSYKSCLSTRIVSA